MSRILYKYKNIGNLESGVLDRHLVKLFQGELYLSNPKDFNDPFDGKFTFSIEGTDAELRRDMIKRGNPPEIADHLLRNLTRQQIVDRSVKGADSKYDLSRIHCFTRDPLSPLMWSHYGQNHFGVCVGIKTISVNSEAYIEVRSRQVKGGLPTPNERLLPLLPVTYAVDRPKPMNILKDRADGLMRFVTTKSIEWAYEQEERIVIPLDWVLSNPVKIPGNSIVEVIFGLRTPKRMIAEVKSITSQIEGIKYFQVVENELKFGLELVERAI